MPNPVQPAASGIGALLRLVEEEKSKAPHSKTPVAGVANPIREATATPLETPILPESPGTARTVGVKPEENLASSDVAPVGAMAPKRFSFGEKGGLGGDEFLQNRDRILQDVAAGKYEGITADAEGFLSGDDATISAFIERLRGEYPSQPKRQPTLDEYKSQGKTAEQWYAETGQQSSLDAIRKDPRNDFNPQTGEVTRVGEENHPSHTRIAPPSAPSGPSLQQYLQMGKTAEQWYAETGRQGELDRMGGRVPMAQVLAATQASEAPAGQPGPLNRTPLSPGQGQPAGRVMGASTALPQQEFIGPPGPPTELSTIQRSQELDNQYSQTMNQAQAVGGISNEGVDGRIVGILESNIPDAEKVKKLRELQEQMRQERPAPTPRPARVTTGVPMRR